VCCIQSLSANHLTIFGVIISLLAGTRRAQKSRSVKNLKGSMKEPNISIYFFFLPITQWCSISAVLFTGGRGVSDFSVLKYY